MIGRSPGELRKGAAMESGLAFGGHDEMFCFLGVRRGWKGRTVLKFGNGVMADATKPMKGCNIHVRGLTLQMIRSWFVVWNMLLVKVHFLFATMFAQHQINPDNSGTLIELNYIQKTQHHYCFFGGFYGLLSVSD